MCGSTVSKVEAKDFLEKLFKHDDDITDTHRNDALVYMLALYDRVAGNSLEPAERYDAIVDFLVSYEQMSVCVPILTKFPTS